jgi:hypothetical protein
MGYVEMARERREKHLDHPWSAVKRTRTAPGRS